MRYLFKTLIGSHIWKMDTPTSDTDIFECYQAATKDILLGKDYNKSTFKTMDIAKQDIADHEIKCVIEELLKNNYNFIVGVYSPIIIEDNLGILANHFDSLQKEIITKKAYNSIHGMCKGNYQKYLERGIDTSERRCNVIMRTINFGINLLETGSLRFKGVTNATIEDVKKGITELDAAYQNSNLPENNESAQIKLEELLYNLRINYK